MKFWNDDWRTELEEKNYGCYERLCECRNTLADIGIMAKLMFKYNNELFTAEECLDRMIEWVCGWNNQFELSDVEEPQKYERMLKQVLTI